MASDTLTDLVNVESVCMVHTKWPADVFFLDPVGRT